MAKLLKNMADTEKMLQQQARQLCEFAANEVYEAINFFLNQYYTEWEPSAYQRSHDLLNSAFKTTVKQKGNTFYAEVGIDYESLDNYENATGYEVISWANTKGIHGGLNVSDQGANTAVFDDAIDSTINSGQLLADCIVFLKGKGFTIIK